jgi:CRISPR/Cas system-associated exonuclease Cas4 (RecB family)
MNPDPLPEPIVTSAGRLHDFIESRKLVLPPDDGFHRNKTGHYAAGKIGECVRANYYRFIEQRPEPRDLKFELERAPIGKAHEAMIVGWFKHAGLLVEEQKYLYDPMLNLAGVVDMEVRDEGMVVPAEIKSIEDPTEWNRGKPKDNAWLQLQCYLMMEKKNHGYFIYTNINELGDWWMFRAERDEATVRWIRERCEALEMARLLGAPPPRPVKHPEDFRQCSWCPFRKPCWEAKE